MSATKSNRQIWKNLTVGFILTGTALGCLFWLVAPTLSAHYFGEWILHERTLGREWSCETKSFKGFPLTYRFICNSPALINSSKSGPISIKAARLSVEYSPYRPLHAVINLYGPAQFEDASNFKTVKANWDQLTAVIKIGIFKSPIVELFGQKILIEAALQETPKSETLELESLSVRLSAETSGSEGEILHAVVSATNIAAPFIDHAAGNTDLMFLNTTFEIQRIDKLRRGDMASRLDAWSAADGLLKFDDFRAAKGKLVIEATGVLQIDVQRRPIGQLNTRAAGLSNLLSRLGIPGSSGAFGGILGGLLRKSPPDKATTQIANPRFISLPLVLRDGGIWIGPIKTPLTTRPLL